MKTAHQKKELLKIPGAKVTILQSKWHKEYTDKMLDKCIAILNEAEANKPEVHILPGSLEIPLAAQKIARSNSRPDAIICFGAIIKGDTFHFELVLQQCSSGLMQVMLSEDMPIIVEVLPVTNIQQLIARSSNDEYNKGIEAAHAAIEIIHWRRELEK